MAGWLASITRVGCHKTIMCGGALLRIPSPHTLAVETLQLPGHLLACITSFLTHTTGSDDDTGTHLQQHADCDIVPGKQLQKDELALQQQAKKSLAFASSPSPPRLPSELQPFSHSTQPRTEAEQPGSSLSAACTASPAAPLTLSVTGSSLDPGS